MNTRDDHPTDLPANNPKPDEQPFRTKSYRPEKINWPDEATEEDKTNWAENQKHIIISGPMYFDKRRQMYYYKPHNGNLMGDGTIDGKAPDQEEERNSSQQTNRYFCRIV